MELIELTEEAISNLENLAGCGWRPEDIAVYLGADKKLFMKEWADDSSKIAYHYKRGVLLAQASVDMQVLGSAQAGNLTAVSQFKKHLDKAALENQKKRIKVQKELEQLDTLQQYINTGRGDKIPEEERLYYEQLDMVRCLHNKYESKSFIINALMTSYKDLTMYLANKVYYEALNFFYLDNVVKKEAWANIYAERLDNAAVIAFEMNDLKTYKELIVEAAKMRGVFKEDKAELPAGFYDRRPIIYSVDAGMFNLPKADRNALANYIDNLPDIPELDKKRLHLEGMTGKTDSNILDINPEDIDYLNENRKG